MNKKIVGITVGTPLSVSSIKDKIKPVMSVNGVPANDEGDVVVRVTVPIEEIVGTINEALQDAKDSGEFDGKDGRRGTGLLRVTSPPSTMMLEEGHDDAKYRYGIELIKRDSGVSEVLAGDTVLYSYYLYTIDYIDGEYAYICKERTSIKGERGPSGYDWTDETRQEIVDDILKVLPTWEGGSF